MYKSALTLFIFIVSLNISLVLTIYAPHETLRLLITLSNELNRIYGLYTMKNDFNYWFSTRKWKETNIKNEYDFIIVGSGSSGSVIANRLSEIKQWKILLIEAGKPETNLMGVPLIAAAFQFTDYDWGYQMEPQYRDFEGLEGRKMYWPRGRALGGTSSINYMIYTRGNPWDYDRWALDGNPGWSYQEVLPYFLKSENANLENADYNYHNTNGYLSVNDPYRSKLVRAFVESGPHLDLPYIDYNAPYNFRGVSTIQATISRGRRHSAATAFLWPIRNRPNLHIITEAFVTKILIEPSRREAYGVAFEKNSKTTKVYARKEVIICAGTFNSPQLLMLSGIGPEQHLNQLGIKVLKDLPVGRNLQDHLTFPGMAFLIDQKISINSNNVLPTTNDYLANGTGPWTSLGGAEGIGYVKTTLADYNENYPDVELLFIGGTLASDYGVATRRGMRISDEVFDSIFRPLFNKNHWTVFPMLLHPKSVGYLELKSKNPRDYPRLFGNFYSDENNHDIKTMIEAIRIVQTLANSPSFKRLNSRLNPLKMRGCEHERFDSDEYWECCLRSISVTLHHQVGTVKMGPEEDGTSVVNSRLQVHGIKKLRVSDCSVIPRALGAHTNAPAIMIGEKTSDIIKEDWNFR